MVYIGSYRGLWQLCAAAALSASVGVTPASAQRPARVPDVNSRLMRPRQARPFQVRPLGQSPAELRRARQVLFFYLRDGMKKPYLAEQTTRILNEGMERTAQLIVRRGGPGKERMEFLSPPSMKGEIVLQVGGRIFDYKPAENKIYEGIAPQELLEIRSKQFAEDLRAGKISVRVTGSEIVADQTATIVEIRGGNGGKRLWIDDKTGVRLRTDELNAQGTAIQSSYFTKVDYSPEFGQEDFLPRSLPRAPHEAQFPTRPPLPSVAEAQKLVPYAIREPSLPEGSRLTGVWVVAPVPGREVTILRYTDGVTTFALFQQPDPRALLNNAPAAGRVVRTNGAIYWTGGGRHFTLLGNVRPAAARQMVDSLR